MTPFSRGRVHLPTTEDAERILNHVEHAFISYPPVSLEVKYKDKVVDNLVGDITTSPLVAQSAPGGTIKLSKSLEDASAEWIVELMGGATSLSALSRAPRRHLKLVS
jgi:hypothetical protein